MSTPEISAEYREDAATFAVAPPYGRPVCFEVSRRRIDVGKRYRCYEVRYVVQLAGSTGAGFSTHRSYEAACRAALSRARKVWRAYSVPRGIAA